MTILGPEKKKKKLLDGQDDWVLRPAAPLDRERIERRGEYPGLRKGERSRNESACFWDEGIQRARSWTVH